MTAKPLLVRRQLGDRGDRRGSRSSRGCGRTCAAARGRTRSGRGRSCRWTAKNLYQWLSLVTTTSRRSLAENCLLPRKLMPRMPLFGPFVDLEDQVDAALRQVDDLRRHGGRDAARAAVELDDAADVLLHLGLGEDAARAHLHLVLQLVVLDARIALEQHLVDDRVLDHLHHQGVALQRRCCTSEKRSVREQRLQRQVELGLIDRVAHLDRQVGEDRLLLDPLVALDDDAADDAALLGLAPSAAPGGARRRPRRRPTPERHAARTAPRSGRGTVVIGSVITSR